MASVEKVMIATYGLLFAGLVSIGPAWAEKTVGEEVQAAGREAVTGTKKAVRGAKDETCKLVKGQLECAGERAKHGARNVKDDVKDSGKEMNERAN